MEAVTTIPSHGKRTPKSTEEGVVQRLVTKDYCLVRPCVNVGISPHPNSHANLKETSTSYLAHPNGEA